MEGVGRPASADAGMAECGARRSRPGAAPPDLVEAGASSKAIRAGPFSDTPVPNANRFILAMSAAIASLRRRSSDPTPAALISSVKRPRCPCMSDIISIMALVLVWLCRTSALLCRTCSSAEKAISPNMSSRRESPSWSRAAEAACRAEGKSWGAGSAAGGPLASARSPPGPGFSPGLLALCGGLAGPPVPRHAATRSPSREWGAMVIPDAVA